MRWMMLALAVLLAGCAKPEGPADGPCVDTGHLLYSKWDGARSTAQCRTDQRGEVQLAEGGGGILLCRCTPGSRL